MTLQRYSCLLCALLLALSLPFSVSASDYAIDTLDLTESDLSSGTLKCSWQFHEYNKNTGNYALITSVQMTSNLTGSDYYTYWVHDRNATNTSFMYRTAVSFWDTRSVALLNKGNALDIGVTGLRHTLNVKTTSTQSSPNSTEQVNYNACDIIVYGYNANSVPTDITDLCEITLTASATSNQATDLLLSIDGVDFDLFRVNVYFQYSLKSAFSNGGYVNMYTNDNYQYVNTGFYYSELSYAVTSGSGSGDMAETNGFLETILKYVKEIWNNVISIPSKLADIFDNIKSGFKNLLIGILELPANLWELLKNGLIELFVPTDAQMSEYSSKWEILLSNRFGALYQSVDLIESVFESFTLSSTTDTLTFPTYSYDFGGGAIFSFGGQSVDVVPDGLEVYFDYLKIIINIVCVLALVNALKTRFVKVLDGGAE